MGFLKKCFFWNFYFLVPFFNYSQANQKTEIARIEGTNEVVAVGDIIQTFAHQNKRVLFKDQTEMVLGPNTHIQIQRWEDYAQSQIQKRIRAISFARGIFYIKTKSVYSLDEPLQIIHPHATLFTHGHEAVVEAGLTIPYWRYLRLTNAEIQKLKKEIFVHVFSGEFYFAKTPQGIRDEKQRQIVEAGHYSALNSSMLQPQLPLKFDPNRYQHYSLRFWKQLALKPQDVSNSLRISLAANTRSPSEPLPAFFRTEAPQRALASASAGSSPTRSSITTASQRRRSATRSLASLTITEKKERDEVYGRRLPDAFSGGESGSEFSD